MLVGKKTGAREGEKGTAERERERERESPLPPQKEFKYAKVRGLIDGDGESRSVPHRRAFQLNFLR